MPALPLAPVQQTALAPALNAIQPTAAPREPAAAPAPSRSAVYRPAQEHFLAFYFCVRSAAPMDRDTAAQHARLAHGTFSIDPLIMRIRPEGESGESADLPSTSARFTVQFAAFATEDAANRFAEQLRRSGVAAKVLLLPRNAAPATPQKQPDPEKLIL
jgi:septal ring-binding cell division protein DamX